MEPLPDAGGRLSRADWRRQNVNELIERVYTEVHREKSWVKVGVSPFGLGRPDRRPPGIAGFSQYDKLYADVELWFAKGWLDYLAPQLYWPIDQAPQAFGTLMEYWITQNSAGRHLWPGLFTSRIDGSARSWKPEDIINQIALMRNRKSVGGHIHFSMVTLMENRQGINEQLKRAYLTPALVPATPWLDNAPPAPPMIEGQVARPDRAEMTLQLSAAPGKPVWQYLVWSRYGVEWQLKIVPASAQPAQLTLPQRTEVSVAAGNASHPLAAISVSAVDRLGNESSGVTTLFLPGGQK